MDVDLGASYRSSRERITAAVRSAVATDATVVAAPVAATPGWSVHDLIAHVAGVLEDVRTGNMAGAPGDAWTAAQVERGRPKPIEQLLDEWSSGAPQIEGFLSTPAGSAAWQAVADVHAHEADLAHALGQPNEAPPSFWAWASEQFLEGFARDVEAAGLPPVNVDASPFDIVRGRLGRRTEDEVRRFEWSADPTSYLDLFFVFGRRDTPLGERPPE